MYKSNAYKYVIININVFILGSLPKTARAVLERRSLGASFTALERQKSYSLHTCICLLFGAVCLSYRLLESCVTFYKSRIDLTSLHVIKKNGMTFLF